MPQSVTAQKNIFTTKMIQRAQQLIALLSDNDQDLAYYAKEFSAGNVFVDADFQTQYPWITAALLTNMITTLTTLSTSMTPTDRDNLRTIMAGP